MTNESLAAVSEPRRIVITGASGNVGFGVLRALAHHSPGARLVGVCRRPPTSGPLYANVEWHAVDLASPTAEDDLAPAMRGADVVVHLALAITPVHDEEYLHRANVAGTQALLRSMVVADVRQLVYASSLGIYAPGATHVVDESWPDTGQVTSTYSRHKVAVERILDGFEREQPNVAISRFRPTVVVQREAAALIRSLYLGPRVPQAVLDVLRRRALPVLPLPAGLGLQFVHADDVGDAVVRLMRTRARGSFNLAADILDAGALADLVGARPVAVNAGFVRGLVALLSRARVIPLTPGWYDVATNSPLMDTSKAHRELGWSPSRSSADSALELIDGLAAGATGTSAAMGYVDPSIGPLHSTTQQVHDVSLGLWWVLTLLRTLSFGRPGIADAVVVAVNLTSGTPLALKRVLDRRRDPVALVAPVAVAGAVVTTWRGGWPALVTTTLLAALGASERRRVRRPERD